MGKLVKEGKGKLSREFDFSYCYTNDLIVFSNDRFKEFVFDIYPKELAISYTKEFVSFASYLDGDEAMILQPNFIT